MESELEKFGKALGQGLGWFGFWIGLGLYNFQGCHHDVRNIHELHHEVTNDSPKPNQ